MAAVNADRSSKPQVSARAGQGQRKAGWTKEEAELSISGVPEVRIRSNFNADTFSVQDYVERLRQSAAAESAARREESAARRNRGEEERLENPFVMTMAELEAHKYTASSVDPEPSSQLRVAALRQQAGMGQQEDLEWDNDLFPQRIEQPVAQRFVSSPQANRNSPVTAGTIASQC